MSGTVIDSLDIQIQASAPKALQALDALVSKIKSLESAVSSLGKNRFDAGNLLGGIGGKQAERFQKAAESYETFMKRISDVGKNFHFSGTFSQLEREITKTESCLQRLWDAESKKEALGINVDSQSWRNLQYDIILTQNKLQNLYDDFERLRSLNQFDFSGIRNLNEVDSASEKIAELPRAVEVLERSTKYNSDAMRAVFDETAAGIETYFDAIQKFGTGADNILNNLSNTGKADPFLAIRKSLLSMEIDLDNLFEKLKTAKLYIPEEDFETLSKQISNASKNVEKLWSKQELSDALGVKDSSREFKTLSFNISKSEENVRSLASQLNRLTTRGLTASPLTVASSTPKIKTASFTQESSLQAIQETAEAAQKSAGKIFNLSDAFKKLQKVGAQVGKFMKKVVSIFNRMGNVFVGLAKKIFGVSASTERYHKSMGKMLARAMLFRTVFRSLSAITSGYAESINSLVQVDSRLNTGMTKLTSSLLFLRNAFSAMTAPLISVVAPVFEYISGKMSELENRAGMFLAALTGQDTYTKAVYVQNDYAKSLDKSSSSTKNLSKFTKDAVKEAKRGIASFDELEIMQSNLSDTADDLSDSVPESTELLPQDMFQTTPIDSRIKSLADNLKELFKAGKWAELGASAAKGLNRGLQKLYNVLKSNKIAEKIRQITDAVSQAFNSFVDIFNWNLLGRVLGAGINDIVRTLNQLIEKIDWMNLGRKIADGVNGLFGEVSWTELGSLIGNKFMILWNTLSGFISNLDFASIGVSFAEMLNGVFSKISFGNIADTLATGINGAFVSLQNFTETFDWEGFAENVRSGISTFLSETDWKKNGQALGDFITHLCEAIRSVMTVENFRKLGEGIGTFLSELPWGTILKTAAEALIGSFGGLMAGLAETPAGLFVDALVVAFTGGKLILKLKGAFSTLFDSASSQAATGLLEKLTQVSAKAGNLAKGASEVVAPVAGIAGGMIGITELTKWLASLGDAARGGDGKLNSLNGTLESFTSMLSQTYPLTKQQSDDLFALGESLENANTSVQDFAVQFASALSETGVSVADLQNAFYTLTSQVTLSEDQMQLLTAIMEQFDSAGIAENIDSTQKKISSSMETAEKDVVGSMDNIKKTTEDTASTVNKTVSENFGNAEKTSVETWTGSQKSVLDALSNMKGASSENMRQIFKNVESYTNSIWNITANNWDAIGKKVDTVLGEMVSNVMQRINQMENNFSTFGVRIKNSIGDLSDIGYNAIIGLNNGMIKAASLMYSNLYKIAQNIPKIFTNTLQIHSPSRVMENIMELSIEGLIVSAKNMAPKLDSTMESMASVIKSMVPNLEVPGFEISTQGIASKMKANLGDMVINMQTDTRMLMPKIEPIRSNNSFGDDIRREIMAISSNTFNNNENIGAAVRSAMNGMAVYADDRIIGYLKEKDIEARNRGGYGIFEG